MIINKTTDCTVDKQLAIRVLFFIGKDLILHVEKIDPLRDKMRSDKSLKKNSILSQNFVGSCADITYNMFQANRSASTLMKIWSPMS